MTMHAIKARSAPDPRELATVAVKFQPAGEQSAWLAALESEVTRLESVGVIHHAQVEPVFPGQSDPRFASLFVVKFHGSAADVAAELRRLKGVKDARPSAPRRAL
jgi:hypothetical protein